MKNLRDQIYLISSALVTSFIFASYFYKAESAPQYSSDWKAISPSRLYERTATDPDLISNRFGVPVDFSYNETRELYNWPWHLNSVPGCPKSIDGYPWVYYGSPPRCFLAGSRGPCGPNSALFLEMYSPYGVCACECLMGRFDYGEDEIVSDDGRFMFCPKHYHKHLVYDKHRKICYNLNDRGPCGPADWFVKDPRTQALKCVPRCELDYYFDWWDSRCKKSQGGKPRPGGISSGGSASYIPSFPCASDERYSTTLRRCLKVYRGPKSGLIIG